MDLAATGCYDEQGRVSIKELPALDVTTQECQHQMEQVGGMGGDWRGGGVLLHFMICHSKSAIALHLKLCENSTRERCDISVK